MPPKKESKTPPYDDREDWAWLHEWAATVDRKLILILLVLREIGTSADASITPELEAEINEASSLSEEIDEKVPDQPTKGEK